MTNYNPQIKKVLKTVTFTKAGNNYFNQIEGLNVYAHLILGAKVVSVEGGGQSACIGVIPYRYNSQPNTLSKWGLIAYQESGQDISGKAYTLEITYIDLHTNIL